MIRHFRFHGRGGEGAKLGSRIVSRAAYLAGLTVQDSPLYGAERRGAPVVAFARVSDGPIRERGYINNPDVTVVLDESLLVQPEAAVLAGLDDNGLVLVNSPQTAEALRKRHAIGPRTVACDVSAIALRVLGQHVLSAPMAGFTVKVAALTAWDLLAEALRIELAAAGLSPELIETNTAVTREVFDAVPAVGISERRAPAAGPPPAPFILPHLSARRAAPSIEAAATSAQRRMAGWRVYRPVVDQARCTRCFLCFALCPEGAIQLDAEHFPLVDYDHCKGCLVCVTACPPKAISQIREAAA